MIVRFTLNSSTRIIEFRGFLGQFSTNFHEILHTLFSIHVVTTLKSILEVCILSPSQKGVTLCTVHALESVAVVVDGMNVLVIFYLVSLVLSFIISWTLGILTHEEDQ